MEGCSFVYCTWPDLHNFSKERYQRPLLSGAHLSLSPFMCMSNIFLPACFLSFGRVQSGSKPPHRFKGIIFSLFRAWHHSSRGRKQLRLCSTDLVKYFNQCLCQWFLAVEISTDAAIIFSQRVCESATSLTSAKNKILKDWLHLFVDVSYKKSSGCPHEYYLFRTQNVE